MGGGRERGRKWEGEGKEERQEGTGGVSTQKRAIEIRVERILKHDQCDTSDVW